MWISYPFSVPTKVKAGQPTKETAITTTSFKGEGPGNEVAIFKERMIYIASGVAFVLLLVLCFILGFWCYRRSHHKSIKRLFPVVVILPTIKRNKFTQEKMRWENTSPCPMISFFNLLYASRYAVKVFFSLGPIIVQTMANGRQVVSI